jgi:hypothetical protein
VKEFAANAETLERIILAHLKSERRAEAKPLHVLKG